MALGGCEMIERPRVAFQGEIGAYSELAIRDHWDGAAYPLPMWDFAGVVEAVVTGRAAFGLLPIRNTLAGPVTTARELLEMVREVHVMGHVRVQIRHCLLALPEATRDRLRSVATHPVAFAQCRQFLSQHPDLRVIPSYDTAGAARNVAAHRDPTESALASRQAAERYGLRVIADDIGDSPNNFTDFAIIAAERGC